MKYRRNSFAIISFLWFLISFTLLVWLNYLMPNNLALGDDAWGAAAVLGNVYEVIVFTLRWDLHPPLYYSVLDIWAVFSKSDLWLQSSSTFFHCLTASLAFYMVLKKGNTLQAVLVAVLILSSPLLLEYSFKIRMYSFIALLSLGLFYVIQQYAMHAKHNYLKWILVLGFVIANSHAIGILFVFFHFIYGLFLLIENDRTRIKSWLFSHAALALLALPAIGNSLVKSVSHAFNPSVFDIYSMLSKIVVDEGLVAGSLILALLMLSLINKQSRLITICYFILPVLVLTAISYGVKPLWLNRNFIFAIPMICVSISYTICNGRVHRFFKIFILLIILLSNMNSFYKKNFGANDIAYVGSIQFLKSAAQKSTQGKKICVISADPLGSYWSINRYLVGLDWGNPFDSPPLINDRWQNIADKLPSFAKKALFLFDTKNYLERENIVIASKFASRCLEKDIADTYIIGQLEKSLLETKVAYLNKGMKIFQVVDNGNGTAEESYDLNRDVQNDKSK